MTRHADTSKTPGSAGLLTTGQAARLCGVKTDTVLKWIKKGRLAASRTAGGHHRIALPDLERFVPVEGRRDAAPAASRDSDADRSVNESGENTPCWDYLSDEGAVHEACLECIVYRVRATRCFLLAGLDSDVGHTRRFCRGSCEDCVYYRWLRGRRTNVLFISADEELVRQMIGLDGPMDLRFAGNGYEASALVEETRPDVVVLDIEGGPDQALALLDSIAADPRLPGVRVIIVAPADAKQAMTLRRRHRLVTEILEKPHDCARLAEAVHDSLAQVPREAGRTA